MLGSQNLMVDLGFQGAQKSFVKNRGRNGFLLGLSNLYNGSKCPPFFPFIMIRIFLVHPFFYQFTGCPLLAGMIDYNSPVVITCGYGRSD